MPRMLRRVLPIHLMKELAMAIKRSTVSFQICLLTPICNSLTLSSSLLLDANLESGLILGATNVKNLAEMLTSQPATKNMKMFHILNPLMVKINIVG